MQQARTKRTKKLPGAGSLMQVILANKAARLPAAIAGFAATAFLVGALLPSGQKAAQSGPVAPISKRTIKHASASTTGQSTVKPAVAALAGRRSVDFYTGDVRASMFSEPVAPAPPAPISAASLRPIRPAPVDPFADWNYTGTASIGDDKIAILENVETHDGVLLHLGDKFLGTKVTGIEGSLLTFGAGKTAKSLFVSMNTSYIPLSASAGFLTAKPTEPTNQPGSFQAILAGILKGNGANAAAAAGGPSVTLPNGRVLSGNALTRYNRRLNQGWNGNTGGGR